MKVAQFPWDPKPEPQTAPTTSHAQATAAPPSAPHAGAAASYTQATLSPQSSAQGLSLPGALAPNANAMAMKPEPGFVQAEPSIKQEPGLPPVLAAYNPANGARPTAAQRAALALESQYGQRAAASINAIHSGMSSQINPAGQQPQQGPRPGQAPQPLNPQQQYRQGVAAAMQQRLQQVPHPGAVNGVPAAQLDGSSDGTDGASLQPSVDSDLPPMTSRAQIDEHLHAQIAARAKEMEGGGLMLPLKEATKGRSCLKKPRSADAPAQFDGLDDDIKSEEDDEDAINSDLDDPDEGGDEDEDDDESMGHMMLCMYDKVQRVKNKWYVSTIFAIACCGGGGLRKSAPHY